jgi:threonine dehydratase
MTEDRITLPTSSDVKSATKRLSSHAIRTPLLEAPILNKFLGGRLLVKAEAVQRTGSFKFRGAYNKISRLSDIEKTAGVVAFSSGNHAQGVAYASQLLGVPATIVMPADAPNIKLNNTQAYGATIVTYDRGNEDREKIGRDIAKKTGATLIKPFDDPEIIAGQGTVGLEIIEQSVNRGVRPNAVVVPVGGGGLIAGIGLGLDLQKTSIPLFGVEPEDFDDTRRSLLSDRREINLPERTSICDSLLAESPGELTFALNRARLEDCLTVSDREVQTAMAAAFAHFKIVVEPGGAVALAAVLSGHISCQNRCIVVVVSGGNVDPQTFAASIDAVEWNALPLVTG